jgi:excinuclease ABC subunit B
MYADTMTDSMQKAISETNRRRGIQTEYNLKNGITPTTIQKGVRNTLETIKVAETGAGYAFEHADEMDEADLETIANRLEKEMREAARALEFERAASLRDKLTELRKRLEKK